jgi:hypothetical protein
MIKMLGAQAVTRFIKLQPAKNARFGRTCFPINSYGTLQKSTIFKKNDDRSDQHQSRRGNKNFGHRIEKGTLLTKLYFTFLAFGFLYTIVDVQL